MTEQNKIINNEFSMRIIETYQSVEGEQETKNKMIEPFFEYLGYDIDCIEDVRTEVTCDVGIKKEKIDYILCIAGIPKILVEAKDWKVNLDSKHINQLYRYFAVQNCKLAILTNGLDYWFFSDLNKENIMDPFPFYKLNVLALKESDKKILNAICKVQQCSYDVEKFIIEYKSKLLFRNKRKLAEMIAVNNFGDINVSDAVFNGITGKTQ